jgi:hypothetical protein
LAHSSPPSARPANPPLNANQRLDLARALDAEICDLHRKRNQDRARILTRIAALQETGGYRSLGFTSVQAYAWKRLGWGTAKVKSLLTLHGRLPKRPLLRAAFEAGDVDWSKAVLVGRAVEREPDREAEWLKAAKPLSCRALEAKVSKRVAEVDGEPEAEVRRSSNFAFTAFEEALVEAGLTALRSEGLALERGAALAELVRRLRRVVRQGVMLITEGVEDRLFLARVTRSAACH